MDNFITNWSLDYYGYSTSKTNVGWHWSSTQRHYETGKQYSRVARHVYGHGDACRESSMTDLFTVVYGK